MNRVPCCVPFCRRSIAYKSLQAMHSLGDLEADEWICPIHWRNVSALVKRLYAKRKRLYRRLPDAEHRARYLRHIDHMWTACKRQAIEGAAGL